MKLIDRFKAAFASFNAPISQSGTHPYATGFWPCWPDQNPFTPLTGASDMTLSSIIMASVNWAGTTLPSAPIQVQINKGIKIWETIPDHPLCSLLEDPNPYFSGITYWKAFAYWWLVYGNVYYYKARNAAGAVVELWLLDSRAVVPTWRGGMSTGLDVFETQQDAGSQLVYRYSGQGLPAEIPPEDILHFRYGMDPNNHLLGLSPVRALLLEIGVDEEISTYTTQIMRNFGVPSFIVSPKPSADNIYNFDAKALDDDIRARTSGAFRGKPLVFNKPMELGTFGFSPDQMGVEKLSRRPETRVCAVLGVPAIVLGFEVGLERSIYSNLRAAQEQAWVNFVIPTQDYIAEVLEDNLLSENIVTEDGNWSGADAENYRVIFDRSTVGALQEDRNALFAREVDAYKFGVKKRSEARSALGLDSGPEDDVYFVEPGAQAATGGGMPLPLQIPASRKEFGAVPSPADLEAIAAYWDLIAPEEAKGLLKAEQAA
jgi:HK97 family phage portal protein